MKKPILLLTISLLPFWAAAQVSAGSVIHLGSNGVSLARHVKAKSGTAKAAPPVARFRVGNRYVPQQRTEPKQLHGAAAEGIKALETFLTAANSAYSRPEEKNVCPNAALAHTFLGNIKQLQPKWNTIPYQQEPAFYVQEHKRRQPLETVAP